jgi:DegV family protein with EDD domain
MLALRAAELADEGWPAEAIVRELDRVRDQSGVLLTVDRYENLIRSGRVSRGRAWLGGLLDIKPVLEIDIDGRVQPVDRVRGRDELVPRILTRLEQRLGKRPRQVRFGVVHAEAPETAERVRTALLAAFEPKEVLVGPATAVLGTHVGEGAWAVFYQVEDGTPVRPDA